MNFEAYRKEINRAEFPDFQQRVLQELTAAQQEGKEGKIMKATRRPIRVTLIAAAVAVLVCISAAAVAIITTAQHKAMADLGMDEDGAVSEYAAYTDENAPTNESGDVKLVSTVCTGANMDAFLLVSPISQEVAVSVQNKDGHYDWGINIFDTNSKGASILLSQVDYDAETCEALVRVTVTSEALTELESVNIPLILFCDGQPAVFYDGVDVPITESKLLAGAADITFSCGRVTGVTVGATYIEVRFEAERAVFDDVDRQNEANDTRYAAVEAALKGSSVQFADGTSLAVSEIKTPYLDEWTLTDGDLSALAEGSFGMQHLCSTVLDTSQIVSVTIAGTVIPVN